MKKKDVLDELGRISDDARKLSDRVQQLFCGASEEGHKYWYGGIDNLDCGISSYKFKCACGHSLFLDVEDPLSPEFKRLIPKGEQK